MLYPEKRLGGGAIFPGQNPGPASDCGPTPWSSVRSNLMTEPHNSALAPLMVPTHCQSVPDTRTGKARVRASPRPQIQPPCSRVGKRMRARGKRAFLHCGSKALPPGPQRGSRWENGVHISEDHEISRG